ncbi:hypothetical protein Bp8pC_136 [Bacillus phage Bp8p-C]|uniref:DUF7448 domain-containing protein n=2 Tax=Agatevirus Bp8pC TaxID=1910937 RepID=A0A0A0PUT5_9CAUD|nr:hypothetical protein AXJ20_gp135 [Bacillus phage Bp8p-C]YP_009784436.1 hypothetical protein QLX39_gp135 [Bacillus phage Bp8p-T]AHJ87566.1 hypothetical protein Bp8pC_136 [Bacillus phage Bp8p-C]AHJ87777.1 hypothetical protein Bp8pT_136 [Bacillus phage Bp8p-T]
MDYGDLKDLNKHLLYKRIVEWDHNKLVLDDGTVITLEMSENDCCALAHGTFSNVKLDAVITNVEIGEKVSIPHEDVDVNEVKVTLYHNQNPIALAEMYADSGNGGCYYSVGSFVVNGIHFPIVDA